MIVTTLFTSTPDPQRGVKWDLDPAVVGKLAGSLPRFGESLTVLHDEPFERPPEFAQHVSWRLVDRQHPNPYIDRWQAYAAFIAEMPDGGQVWCVDANDVVMLHRPAPVDLACGSEPSTLGTNTWLNANHALARGLAQAHPTWPLLNAGIIGGRADHVHPVAEAVYRLAADARTELTDMAAFNLAVYARPHLTGEPVHTRFKAYETDHPSAWFAHK